MLTGEVSTLIEMREVFVMARNVEVAGGDRDQHAQRKSMSTAAINIGTHVMNLANRTGILFQRVFLRWMMWRANRRNQRERERERRDEHNGKMGEEELDAVVIVGKR